MLSQARSTSRRISQCRSIISHRHPTHARFLTVPTSQPTKTPQKPPIRTAHVRTWEPPRNIADTYAILRVLERKYGKILEARFLKDYEDPSRYQMVFWVVFEDPKSLERIPPKGGEFVYKSTKLSGERHEISMEELEALAQSEDFVEESDAPVEIETAKGKNISVGGGRIIRGEADLTIPGSYFHTIFQMTAKPVMGAFLRWGGFQLLTPLPKRRTIEEYELFGKTDLDQVRMRASLQLSARLLGVPNPSISPAKQPTSQTSKAQPLSSLVFGDANTSQSASSAKAESATSIPQDSTVGAPSQPPSSPPPPKTATKPRKAVTPEPEAPPPPPKEKDAATIAAELKAQELLKRQLQFARQLKDRAYATRRKQPKPQIKQVQEKPPTFSEADTHQLPELEVPTPGVLDRIWGMFGRK